MEIRASDIQAVLGGSQILRGVDLRAERGELVGIIGPNGSGKSTLLKCIYRVLQPTGGVVYLDGRALSEYSYKQSARQVAVVAQHNYYNFDFSVLDVVMMGRAPHKRALDRDNAQDHQMVAQALKTVGMADFARRSFATLSGGEQQRVALARAIVNRPDILLADVPCSGLGVIGKKADIRYKMTPAKQTEIIKLQRKILDTVWKYVKVGGTLIYSTCTIGAEENQYNVKTHQKQHNKQNREVISQRLSILPLCGFLFWFDMTHFHTSFQRFFISDIPEPAP